MNVKKMLFRAGMLAGPLTVVLLLAGLGYFLLSSIYEKIAVLKPEYGLAELFLKLWKDLKDPIAGTLMITVMSVVIAAPLGIITGVYLHELAGKRISKYGMDIFRYLSSVPSIVIGVFGLIMIISFNHIFGTGIRTGILISALSLSLLILPYIVHSTAGALSMVPDSVRITAVSLGAKKYQNILYVLLPESIPGILGGIVLSIGRAAEDTAVIMLTGAAAFAGIPDSLGDSFEALPFFIYYKSSEYQGDLELAEIFIASAVIIVISTVFILLADKMSAGMKRKLKGEKKIYKK